MQPSLADRLRRVLGNSRPKVSTRPREVGPLQDIAELVDGVEVVVDEGACFATERRYPRGHLHGRSSLDAALDVPTRAWGVLLRDQCLGDLAAESMLFLDTETTGLSGGTGTFVFMVGMAFFEDGDLVARQVFMRHHAEETALLGAIRPLLRRFDAVVSFNGKAFDVPLLRTRHSANRVPWPLEADAHLDLLFPARRLWRDRLDSCTLQTLERHIVGHARDDDIPGWMIPDAYFRYLRGGDAYPIAQVFRHNLDDVLSLVALCGRIGAMVAEPARVTDHGQRVQIGRLYEETGFRREAAVHYRGVSESAEAGDARGEAAARLGWLLKRQGDHDAAAEVWRRMIGDGARSVESSVELAKYLEHRKRDVSAAIQVVEALLMRRDPVDAATRAELQHRLARLYRKCAARR
jgi:hypothetical protein